MSDEIYENAVKQHALYAENNEQWTYLLNSYSGGAKYRKGQYLRKYVNETDPDYQARIESTYLNNQCSSVVSVYNSFLFREPPVRELGTLENLQETEDFLKDADYDGRSLNDFMEEVSTWASVFGHTWILVVKPNINANTRADEIALGVRPYVVQMSPLVVLDWKFERNAAGAYQLTYFKYIEDTNGDEMTIREWTPTDISTIVVDTQKEKAVSVEIEVNGLGKIPAVPVYNKKIARGLGLSDINDIADAQRYDYNLNSEVEQSVRIDSHPSIVGTKDTDFGAGAGSIIVIPDDLDPGLMPNVIKTDGANIGNIIKAKQEIAEAVDTMANTGSVRATESKTLSGVAMQTEFQLLNAKLSGKANNLELAEEQMWALFATYQAKEWDGTITYPGSFNIQDNQFTLDKANTLEKLIAAWKAGAIDYEALFNYLKELGIVDDEVELDAMIANLSAEDETRLQKEVTAFTSV